ncbi:pimeloyl-ACP methyl ester carboxylesterase [Tamaricihabitans halophyticus]|uniref:Pimeloyl-ACP methyl ester carboxylesterase n=1 Tax=Tamaricihabitans halophyticus TaxID=1262583 RepID=A0A4R2RA70_9PSEU|nr:alpha/beta fold hydrolase [Tamaricihabitans halophyticus]TCP56591.1 pimeloyl-ACP methyl ester carboxylesterase [Tamaricihabitans halophyticus]
MGEVVFLHGLGATPASWDAQLASLPGGYRGFAPSITGLADTEPADFTFARAATGVRAELDRRGIERAHLCGLSLGAMVSVRFAIDYPDRVATLVLSGGQVRPSPVLMAAQSAITRLLPARFAAPDGMSKQRMLAVTRQIAAADFRGRLGDIGAPTLVLCGSRDFVNLPAARALASGIPGARLRVITGGGHPLNTQKPEEFAAELAAFLPAAEAQ